MLKVSSSSLFSLSLEKKDFIKSFQSLQEKGIIKPVTLSNKDPSGAIVQLWKYSQVFFGVIRKENDISLISMHDIRNGMCPQENAQLFLSRIANNSLKKMGINLI